MREISVIVTAEEAGERVDALLSRRISVSRSAAVRLIEEGNVRLREQSVKKNLKVASDDELCVTIPEPRETDIIAEDIPLDVVYEDEYLLVVNKPRGMVVHPAAGNPDGTLVNALMAHCAGKLSGINGVLRPGIVHRIDKDTSGLLLVAKCDEAHLGLAAQIKEHTVTREYRAIINGVLRENEGSVNLPVGRSEKDRKKMCVTEKNSKNAITHYSVICTYNGFSHISCRLETGRTHQIRVHMAHLGHPIVGDTIYGARDKLGLKGQCLHSKTIEFFHPILLRQMSFESELPKYFLDILARLE